MRSSCSRWVPTMPCCKRLFKTYGILGYDDDLQQNIELMEKGRGSEYGFVGGSGGSGCLVVGFSDGAVAGHTADFVPANSVMVIADQSGEWAKVQSKAPLQYGGITKTCWKVVADGNLASVPFFWIADTSLTPTGVATFTDDAANVVKGLLQKKPAGFKEQNSVGIFPCFTRGVNHYGAENVESEAISKVMEHARVFGMFAHGELGPSDFAGFTAEANQIACNQHSMTSILSIHTAPM